MGFLDDVKKGARKFGDTIYEQNFTEKGQREQRKRRISSYKEQRKRRISSYKERAREIRAEARLLRAEKERDRYRGPSPSFGMGDLSGFGLPSEGRKKKGKDPASLYGY